MKFSLFFVDRPIFATVVAILLTIIGGVSYFGLPVTQYPEITPPTIQVTASYPGASAETVANTVATPIEQEINGVEGMLYMLSQSTGDGSMTLSVTFKLGTDLDAAQVLVQNRRRRRRTAPSRGGQPAWRDHAQVLARPDDGHSHAVPGRLARPALHLQLRAHPDRRPARPDRGRRQRDGVFRTRLLDPHLARSRARGRARTDRGRGRLGPARQQRPGRLGHAEPPADRGSGRLRTPGGDARAAVAHRRVRGHRHRRIRRRSHPRPRHRARRTGRAGLFHQRLPGQQRRPAHRHLPAPRLQRAGNGRPGQGGDGGTVAILPRRPGVRHRLQPDRVHRREHQRGLPHDHRGGHSGRSRDPDIPSVPAGHADPDRRRADQPDRHVLRDVDIRLLAEQPDAVRPGAVHRHRRR